MPKRPASRRPLAAAALLSAAVLAGCGALPDLGLGKVSGQQAATAEAASRVGQFRRAHGLDPLSRDGELEGLALEQARQMARARSMSHSAGRTFSARMSAAGIGTAAENIARGQNSAGAALQAWERSPPHRRNLLDRRFDKFGMASATDAKGERYWAMVLGR